MSTKPGVTIRPVASISSCPEPVTDPPSAIRSPSTATSATNGSPPEPSTTVPPRTTRSCALMSRTLRLERSGQPGVGHVDLDHLDAALAHRGRLVVLGGGRGHGE